MTMRIYINGVLDMVKTTNIGMLNTIDTSPLRIGAGINGAFTGAVDELEIFNRALSDTEVYTISTPAASASANRRNSFPPLRAKCTARPEPSTSTCP